MKKNDKNVSKNAANLMRKIEKKDLESTVGGLLLLNPCRTCGILQTHI